ncbi:MAG: Gfo/Idh/MocA family protein [Anaerolineae bacterium]
MDTIRFALVGCGEIGIQTAEGMAAAPHAVIVAATDPNQALAEDLTQRFGGRAVATFEDVLTDPTVDAVYIATPHFLHAPMAIQVAQAGKHLLLEKPIATSVADARRIIDAFDMTDTRLSVAFLGQVDANCRRLKELLGAGAIGTVSGIRYAAFIDKPESYWHGGYTGRAKLDWRVSKEKAGGGVLIMNLIHDFNSIRFITGLEVVRAYGEYGTFATPVEVEDLAFASLRYDNGAIGSVEAGSAIRGGAWSLTGDSIYGTEGQVTLDSGKASVYSVNGSEGVPAAEWTTIDLPQPSARESLAEGFALALLEGRTPPVTGYDGLKALEVVEAIYRSGEAGAPVSLPLP